MNTTYGAYYMNKVTVYTIDVYLDGDRDTLANYNTFSHITKALTHHLTEHSFEKCLDMIRSPALIFYVNLYHDKSFNY